MISTHIQNVHPKQEPERMAVSITKQVDVYLEAPAKALKIPRPVYQQAETGYKSFGRWLHGDESSSRIRGCKRRRPVGPRSVMLQAFQRPQTPRGAKTFVKWTVSGDIAVKRQAIWGNAGSDELTLLCEKDKSW